MKSKPRFLTDIEKKMKEGLEKNLSAEMRIKIFESGIQTADCSFYLKSPFKVKNY